MTHNQSLFIRLFAPWGIAGILSTALGCGGHETTAVLDAADLLERYDKEHQQHDPTRFSEYELGAFMVTKREEPKKNPDPKKKPRRNANAIFHIHFKICAVVADEEMTEFTESLTTHGERLRGLIRETVEATDLEDLASPDLGMLTFELTKSINECLSKPIVRSVVFSDFYFQRG
jgi:hypothetical protein